VTDRKTATCQNNWSGRQEFFNQKNKWKYVLLKNLFSYLLHKNVIRIVFRTKSRLDLNSLE
jgi:hypothetical protein